MRHLNGTALLDVRHTHADVRQLIEMLLHRAILTCRELDDPDAALFTVRSSWPKYARDFWDAYHVADVDDGEVRFVPERADHDHMLDVLAWGRGLDRVQWLIARDVALGFSWAAVGDRMHLPVAVVCDRYDQALEIVVQAALAA